MKGVSIDGRQLKEYSLVALAYLLVSMAFFWPLLGGITSTVPGSGGDVFQSLWELWWVPYSLFTLHASPYVTNLIFYPAGANLATQTFAPIAGIFSALFQWARRGILPQCRVLRGLRAGGPLRRTSWPST